MPRTKKDPPAKPTNEDGVEVVEAPPEKTELAVGSVLKHISAQGRPMEYTVVELPRACTGEAYAIKGDYIKVIPSNVAQQGQLPVEMRWDVSRATFHA